MRDMEEKQKRIGDTLALSPVVPVLVVEDVSVAVPLGRALVDGGCPVLEVTLRTPEALDVIRAMIADVEGAVVGAGTVKTPEQFEAVDAAGCAFAVSPGASPHLLDAADAAATPLLPGAATAGEAMTLLERGYRYQKFFPAAPAGGPAYLKGLASPIPEVRFCPTGGIGPDTADSYLSLPNVVCVGGSWLAPKDAVHQGDWQRIRSLARAASRLPH
jgi:2-dehydro-3-deoxyphosphogluconate aldolase/(4S)-4-hydroxy-2-oxoglutarate aldolase